MGESYTIKQNFEWERITYLATMIHNVNCSKRKDMIKPHELFRLPQDNIKPKNIKKSTKEQFEAFVEKVESLNTKGKKLF